MDGTELVLSHEPTPEDIVGALVQTPALAVAVGHLLKQARIAAPWVYHERLPWHEGAFGDAIVGVRASGTHPGRWEFCCSEWSGVPIEAEGATYATEDEAKAAADAALTAAGWRLMGASNG
jgi:hypothetical protein